VVPGLASRIAHLPIRTRGTVGGSIAHADPAAELPVLARVLDAELRCTGPTGERTVAAGDFFLGMFHTALDGDEVLTEVDFPALPAGVGVSHEEFTRRAGDFAIVLAIALLRVADERITHARVAVGGVASVPVRLAEAEALLLGQPPSPEMWAEAAAVAEREVEPTSDIHASAAYRRHLVGVLVRRALEGAARRSLDT
jgi:carbon-monoxide dehydrogenase medium subunit